MISCGRAHIVDIVQYCFTVWTHFLVAGVIKVV